MDTRVQRLDAAVEHLRELRHLLLIKPGKRWAPQRGASGGCAARRAAKAPGAPRIGIEGAVQGEAGEAGGGWTHVDLLHRDGGGGEGGGAAAGGEQLEAEGDEALSYARGVEGRRGGEGRGVDAVVGGARERGWSRTLPRSMRPVLS